MSGPGFGVEPEDQVPRLERFRQRHPDIDVTPGSKPDNYGQWTARRDGKTIASDYELRWLLDDLERIFAP